MQRNSETPPQVPFADIARNLKPYAERLHRVACEIIDRGSFIGGAPVKSFEENLAAWLGLSAVCGVGCATSGLTITMKALGIGSGDQVITTANSAMPTPESISLTGAEVVFCDIEGGGFYNIDPTEIEAKISSRTKALLPVHLYGHPCNLERIRKIAQRHGLHLIEDCAQAQGARYRGRYVGTFGEAGVFSFFPSKNLGGFGDGGAVASADRELIAKVRRIANHGRGSHKYLHEVVGTNSRLDTLQAAMLDLLLPDLDAMNAARRRAAARYRERLAGIDDIVLPGEAEHCEPVYHVYVVVVPDREALIEFLGRRGIATGIHYPRALNLQPAYACLEQGEGAFPKAEYACRHMLSLPMFPTIGNDEIDRVCEAVSEFFK